MKKKPITTFLKVMSILTLIQCCVAIIFTILAFLSPQLTEILKPIMTAQFKMDIIVSAICYIINIVLAVMALQHKNLGLVTRVSAVTLAFLMVFSVIQMKSFTDFRSYFSILASAVIPALFYLSAYGQNKIDKNTK